jgi:hypothetical protein
MKLFGSRDPRALRQGFPRKGGGGDCRWQSTSVRVVIERFRATTEKGHREEARTAEELANEEGARWFGQSGTVAWQ